MQTYSAFANTIGGLILLGVDEDLQEKDVSKRFQIIGVDEPSKIITDFWNTLNSDKVNENILITRGDIAKKIGISVTAVQKHINKLKSLRFIDRDGSAGHGNWRLIE